MGKEPGSAARNYAVAAIAVAVAGGIRVVLDPLFGVYTPVYLPFTLAIIFSGRLGGRGPSLASTAFSVLAVWLFSIESRTSSITGPLLGWSLALFAVVGILISLLVGDLRRALVALAGSEEHLRLATLSSEVGLWSRTYETSDVVVSANWRRLFGIAPDVRVTLDTWLNAVHPEDRDRAVGELDSAKEQHADFKREYRTLWPDGTVRWIVDRGRVYYAQTGHANGSAGVSVDITERKQAEDALRRTGAELREAERIAHVGSWYWDPKTDEVTGSEETYRVYGWDPRLPMPAGKDHELLYTAESWARARASARGALQGKSFEVDLEIARANGGTRWITVRGEAAFDTNANVVGIRGTVQDITERKFSEYALRESEDRFRALVTASSDAVYSMSPDWSEMRHLHGRDFIADTETPSRDWLQKYIDPDDQERVVAAIKKAIRTGSVFELEHRVLRVDGSLGWTFSRAIPIQNANGEIVEWFGAASDISERKQAEEGLRESEAQFRTLANAIPQLCWMAHADGEIFWYNQRWYEYTGSAAEEMMGWGWQSVHDPVALPVVVERWKASIAAGTPFDMTFPLRGADGVFRPFLTRVMPVRDRDGKVARWFGTNTDIGEQHKIEKALRESEDRLRTFVRYVPAGVAMLDREMRYLQVSDRWCADFSLKSDEMLGRSHYEIFPDVPERWKEVHRRCLAGETLRSEEDCWERSGRDAVWLCWEMRPWGEWQGKPEGVLIFSEDITPRKRMEVALRETAATTRTLLETAAQAILAVDLEGGVVLANRMAEEMFGYARDEMLGRPLDMFVPERFRLRHRSHRADFAANPRTRPMGVGLDLQALRRDGTEFPIEISLSTVETGRGALAVAFVTDITKRKQTETSLRNSEKELRALARSLLTAQEDERRRLARELHDDVTQRLALLSIEIGKLVAESPSSVAEIGARLRSFQSQARHASVEVRRLCHGLHPSVIEDFGLSIALEEFCGEFAAAEGISLTFDGPAADVELSADSASCLYRIAQECLRNTAKHAHATEIRVQLTSDGASMQLAVKDNGAGYSVDPERVNSGLGLVSMKERIRMANGTLSITSQPGQGTAIVATVPLSGACP